jgi:hypothetical protein
MLQWRQRNECMVHAIRKCKRTQRHDVFAVGDYVAMYKTWQNVAAIHDSQVGFRPAESNMDEIVMVKDLLGQSWAYNVEIYQIFIEFQKPYDSIWRDRLPDTIKFFGMSSTLLKLIKPTKEDSTFHVTTRPMVPHGFKVWNGLKQGDSTQPL